MYHRSLGLVVAFVLLSPIVNAGKPLVPDWFPKAPPLPKPTGEVLAVKTVSELYTAVNNVKPGGTILVADGLYQMPSTLVIKSDSATLRSQSGDRTKVVLEFAQSRHLEGVAVSHCSGATIADLTIQNVGHNCIKINSNLGASRVTIYNVISHNAWQRHIKAPRVPDKDGKADFVDDCRVQYCLFYNDRPKQRGDEPSEDSDGGKRFNFNYVGGMDVMCARGWVVSDNVFTGIRGKTGEARGAIFMWHNGTDCVIQRNLIIDCDTGICMGNSHARGERRHANGFIVRNNFVVRCSENNILADHTRNCKVLNNTVHDPDSRNGRLLRVVHANDGLVVANNIFSGPRIVAEQYEGRIDVRNNLIRPVGDYFVDAAKGDLHLTARATDAINRATVDENVSQDIDGQPEGNKPDLGADEWVAIAVGGQQADNATSTSWLNAEDKDGRWQSLTAGLRAILDGLKLTAAQEKRWGPVLRDHCDKIQDHVDMQHLYAELYCDQAAMMAADLKARRAPLSSMSGKCVPFMYWSDHLQCVQGVRLVVPPEYDPAKEYQFFMYYKMGGSLVWKVGEKWVNHKTKGAVFQDPYHPTLDTCTRLGKDTFHGWSSLSSQVKGRKGAPQEFAEVIAALSRDFSVSTDRGFASGYSDGGFTPLFLASRFPHLLAGIAPEVANWQNMNIGTYGWLNVPILVIDGWGDQGYMSENIGRFHYLSTMGADIEAMIGDHGHVPANDPAKIKGSARAGAPYDDDISFTYLMDWARSKRRNLWPKRVRYGTFNLYWNRAYWVTIEDITNPALGAIIDVQVEDGNQISVKAKNITSFRLQLSDKLVDPNQDVRVVVNGKENYKGAFQDNLLIELAKRDPATVRKTHAMPGGIMVAMDQANYSDDLRRVGHTVPGQTWSFVRPSQGDEAAQKLYDRQFPEWSRQDTKVDQALIEKNHLVVWGGPDMNAFCARVADKLPVKIEKGRFTIGSRVYDQPGQSVRFLCPNPLNPKRYLIVYAWTDFKTVAAGGFHGLGGKFLTPSAWGLRYADCQVWGENKAANSFSITMGASTSVDYYNFDAHWQPPSEEPLGSFQHDVDFQSLHVLKADAIQEITRADVGLVGSLVLGPNRWNGFLKAGPVTLNDLATTHMFPDYIMTCQATGSQLKSILSRSAASTVLRDENDPAYEKGRTLTLNQIQDDKVYTVAADYASCTGVLSFAFNRSKITENPAIFKTATAFAAHQGLSLPCRELKQTDIEVTEALAAYIKKRGKVKVRGLCGDLRYYLTNPAVHNYGAYDFAHIKFNIPLGDPTQNAPRQRQESLAIALARPGFKGGAARSNANALLHFTEAAPCTGDLSRLDQKLPVRVQTSSKRLAIQGSCNKATDLKLVPAGKGKAGEVVIVRVTLENHGDTDLEGLSILAPSHNTSPRRDTWPSSKELKLHKARPGMWGLHTIAGHFKRPHQHSGVFLASATGLPDYNKDFLIVPGTGYAKGLVGIKKPLKLKAGKTEKLFVIFLAANADNPKTPVNFDFLAVAMALKEQLEAETGQLALQPE